MAWPTESGSIAQTMRGGVLPPPAAGRPGQFVATVVLPPAIPVSIGKRADSLKIELAGSELDQLATAGELQGTVVRYAAGANGTGTGLLRSYESGTLVSWRGPGDGAGGPQVDVSAGGVFLIESIDRNKYIRLETWPTYMAGPTSARVQLTYAYGGIMGGDDVTAAEASAGDVTTYTLDLTNTSGVTLSGLLFSVADSGVGAVEISNDGAAYGATATLPDMPASGTDQLFVRRTITAGETFDPAWRTILTAQFDGQ